MVMVERALCPVLVGRAEELSILEDALLAANRGQGSVVALAGDAGLGKTRLATQLEHRARADRSRVAAVRKRKSCRARTTRRTADRVDGARDLRCERSQRGVP